jgi:RimJ/RimL family protein N-acetyltransferase
MALQSPVVETPNLRLRPLRKDDAAAITAYLINPAIQRYLDQRVREAHAADEAFAAMQRLSRLTRVGDTLCLAIERRRDGTVLGHVSLRWVDATAGQGEIRIVLAPQFRGEGYGTEVMRAMLAHGFDTLGLHRIFARCGSSPAAIGLLKSVGMRMEAHFREHALFQGNWDEELHFALLAREWKRPAKVSALLSRAQVA